MRGLINAVGAGQFEIGPGVKSRRCASVCGLRAIPGPFGGLLCSKEPASSEFAPKLPGTYECELHGVVPEVILSRPALIVDTGCAEGRYPVRLAHRCPEARALRKQRRRLEVCKDPIAGYSA
jgi:hypothetical protein